jgi:hypothetical protein
MMESVQLLPHIRRHGCLNLVLVKGARTNLSAVILPQEEIGVETGHSLDHARQERMSGRRVTHEFWFCMALDIHVVSNHVSFQRVTSCGLLD